MSSERGLEVPADVGAPDAEHDRADVDRDEAVAVRRRSASRRRRGRDARARRASAGGGDPSSQRPPRGSARDASEPMRDAEGEAEPRRPASRNVHQTKSSSSTASAAAEREHRRQREAVVEPGLEVQRVADRCAARAGSSRRSRTAPGRWATSSAPTRNDSASRGRSSPCVRQRDDPRRDRHRERRACAAADATRAAASRASTSSPSRNRITTSATIASVLDEAARRRRSSSDLEPALAEGEPDRTNSAVSDRKLRRASPDSSAPPTSSAAEDRASPSRTASTRIESQTSQKGRGTMRITVLGKSPSWQDAGGACSGYLVEEGDTRLLLDCGNGVFAKLREHLRLRRRLRGRRCRTCTPTTSSTSSRSPTR